MIPVVFLSFMFMVLIAVLLGTYRRSRGDDRIREVIQGLIAAEMKSSNGKPGMLAGLPVLLAATTEPALLSFANPLIPENLRLVAKEEDERETAPELLTGDADFDEEIFVLGDPDSLLAVLDHETRQQLRSQIQEGATLKEGFLQRDLRTPEEAGGALRFAQLARRLELSNDDIPARLRLHATTDPTPGFRIRGHAAEVLATALGKMGDIAAQPCLLRLMARHDSSLRLCVIEALAKVGDAGPDALSLDRELPERPS